MTTTETKSPPTITVKFRLPEDIVDALVIAAHQRREDHQSPNVSAIVRMILREELLRPPPPPETYADGRGGDVYNVRMSHELLEALELMADTLKLASLSTLIRSMLRRWLSSKGILQTKVRK
jgi:hypothetical protein